MSKPNFKKGQIERRFYTSNVELRSAAEGEESRAIAGVAANFNERTQLWPGVFEQIDPQALKGADMSDVVCRGNHDNNQLLGRTSNGTLRLEVTDAQFRYECDVTKTTKGNDWLEDIRSGNVDKSSFAFITKTDKWEKLENGDELRTILEIEIVRDVAPVVFPAYSGSSVEARDIESARASYQDFKGDEAPDFADEYRDAENLIEYYSTIAL